jgi:iron complex outermembrane receptor protein
MIVHKHTIGPRSAVLFALILAAQANHAFADSAPAGSAPATQAPAAGGTAPVQLENTVVTGNTDVLAPETPVAAAAALTAVPGATTLVNSDEDLKGDPALSQKSIFAFQPSVYAQGSGASEGVKISIRGSGIGNPVTYNRGVELLFDGLTFPGFGMSGNAVIFNETLGLDYTEVLPGANGFDYQSLGLGGTVNYVSLTGYNADRFLDRVDFGSYGYISNQIATGAVDGKADYFASLVTLHSDGFQKQTRKDSVRLLSDFGYKVNDNVETRVFVRYGSEFIQNPGSLTLAQINSDISQTQKTVFKGVATLNNILGDNYSENPFSVWIGSKTVVKLDQDSTLTVGATVDDIPYIIYTTLPYAIQTAAPSYTVTYNTEDVTYLVGWERDGLLNGRHSITNIDFRGLDVFYGLNRSIDQRPGSPTYQQTIRQRNTDGTGNDVISASNNLEVAKGVWLKTGISGIHDDTVNKVALANDVAIPINNQFKSSAHYNYNYVAGLTDEIASGIQLFGNVSRSVEQATALSKSNSLTNSSSIDLKDQVGITEEVGVRGQAGPFEGSLSVYNTDLHNEFLTVVINPNTSPATTQSNNASPTVHKGIEAALDTTLWKAAGGKTPKDPVNRVLFRQSYTLSDFYFKNDSQYKGNFIPSIPPVSYQAELRYEDDSGFFAAANTFAAASYYADYTNTFKVPGFTTYGATLGYKPRRARWEGYVTLSNIGNKSYVATTRPNYNNGGADSAALYTPGDPREIFAGVTFHY